MEGLMERPRSSMPKTRKMLSRVSRRPKERIGRRRKSSESVERRTEVKQEECRVRGGNARSGPGSWVPPDKRQPR